MCCFEKWAGEQPDIAAQGMEICYQNCLNNSGLSGRCKVFLTGLQGATGAVWENAFPIVVSDPGTKLGQAQQAITQTEHCTDLIVVGYSWGADSAIIFAQLTTKPIRGFALLGAPLVGGSGHFDVEQIWEPTMNYLLNGGTRIYVLGDISTQGQDREWRRFQGTANPRLFTDAGTMN